MARYEFLEGVCIALIAVIAAIATGPALSLLS